MSLVAAPADRRFRRAHVKPARRRRLWRVLILPLLRYGIAVALLAYIAYRGADIALHAHTLQVQRIVVKGNERLSNDAVLAVLDGLKGESLLWTDLDRWRKRLLSSPWIRDASLRRSLPSTVEVAVTERQPMGLARIDGALYLVDAHGVVLDEYGPRYADIDLPMIDGLAASDETAPTTDEGRADLAAQVITSLKTRPEIAARLSQIDVRDAHNAIVILTGDSAVIQLGEEQFLPRLQSYLELASALRERVAEIDSVDLRFDGRIYVRPPGKMPLAAALKTRR
jgi:cell division protein FtsQ